MNLSALSEDERTVFKGYYKVCDYGAHPKNDVLCGKVCKKIEHDCPLTADMRIEFNGFIQRISGANGSGNGLAR